MGLCLPAAAQNASRTTQLSIIFGRGAARQPHSGERQRVAGTGETRADWLKQKKNMLFFMILNEP